MDSELPEGWFYNNFDVIQKTHGRVYCYIQAYFGFYCLQLYVRGNVSICDLEFRDENLDLLFTKADEWLTTYEDGNLKNIYADWWSPKNPKGYWNTVYKKSSEL